MTIALAKTTTVLDLAPCDRAIASAAARETIGVPVMFRFTQDTDPTANAAPSVHGLELDRATWHDMGDPRTITVTVEPGDRLNP